jgi:hypothetical protein
MSKHRRPTVPLQLATQMATGAGFHAQASSDSFEHRLDIAHTGYVQRAERSMPDSRTPQLQAIGNQFSRGPRRTMTAEHCYICLAQEPVTSPSPLLQYHRSRSRDGLRVAQVDCFP